MPVTHCLPAGSPAASSQTVVPGINLTTMVVNNPTGLKRGTFVMLHGIGSGIAEWQGGSFATMVTDLVGDGWQVLIVPDPGDTDPAAETQAVANDINGDPATSTPGLRWKNTYLHTWDHIVQWRNANYNPLMPLVPCGFSIGGFGTLQVAQNKTVLGYIAHCPATVIYDITLFSTLLTVTNTSGADLTNTCLNAVTVPGNVSWSTNDTVVGDSNTITITNNAVTAGQPVTTFSQAIGHSYDSTTASTQFSWVQSTLDPLAPKTY